MALLRQALIVTGLISKSIYIQQSYCIEIPKRKKLKKKTNELDCLWVVFLRVYQYRTYLKANSWTWICDEIVYRSPKGMPFLKCTMWIRKTVLQNKSSHLKKKKIHSFMEEDFINFYRNRSLLSFKKEKKIKVQSKAREVRMCSLIQRIPSNQMCSCLSFSCSNAASRTHVLNMEKAFFNKDPTPALHPSPEPVLVILPLSEYSRSESLFSCALGPVS